MALRIYLAGYIGADPASFEWRNEAEIIMRHDNVELVNPAKNKLDEALLSKYKGNEKALYAQYTKSDSSAAIFVPKSYWEVKKSDIIIANFDITDKDRPMVGTLFEVAWALEDMKPVISICKSPDTNVYAKHPFIKRGTTVFVDNIEQACGLVRDHWL